MRILTRYLLREVVSHAALGVAIFTLVLFTKDLGRILELVVRNSASLTSVLQVISFILPVTLTITIPAGAVGNEKPISIVTETWFAPAIAAVVESTTDDPRYGKTTYQLTNVQLSEPARSLFEPPTNFKLNVRK